MNDDRFTDTLRAVLDNPPLPPASRNDVKFTTAVDHAVARRQRFRHLTVGSIAAAAVAAAIIVPTVVVSTSGDHHRTQQASTSSTVKQNSGTSTKTGAKSMLSTTDMVNMIMVAAEAYKDPTPTAIHYVYGTRNDLNTFIAQATIDGADGQAPCVLVEATGNFSWFHSAYRGSNHTSTGTAIVLIINQETGDVTDQGILPQPVDLSPVGQVFQAAVPKK